jgi:hypothetical protein
MFAPMTPQTERVRIKNEMAELNRRAAERRPLQVPPALLKLLRFARPQAQRPLAAEPVVRQVRTSKSS